MRECVRESFIRNCSITGGLCVILWRRPRTGCMHVPYHVQTEPSLATLLNRFSIECVLFRICSLCSKKPSLPPSILILCSRYTSLMPKDAVLKMRMHRDQDEQPSRSSRALYMPLSIHFMEYERELSSGLLPLHFTTSNRML